MLRNNLIVYEIDWIIKRIYQVSDRIRNELTDQTLFEERCIKRIGSYLNGGEGRKNNRRYIEKLINEVAKSVVERNKNELADLFSSLSTEDEEGEEVEFEPIDVLANVESDVIAKEMSDLLAQDGQRTRIIVENWAIGNTNNSFISRSLARSLGGNEETHRKYINRFRAKCTEMLASVD